MDAQVVNIAICHADPAAAQRLYELCRTILDSEYHVQIVTALSGEELLRKDIPFQIVLMDTRFPGENGIDIARALLRCNDKCRIIFVTDVLEDVSEVYAVPHFCLILQDQLEEQLPRFLKRAAALAEMDARKSVPVLCGRQVEEVALNQLVMLERRGHDTYLALSNGREIRCKEKVSDILRRIGSPRFVRSHISYALNLAFVDKQEDNGFRLKTGHWVPISRSHMEECRNALWEYESEEGSASYSAAQM